MKPVYKITFTSPNGITRTKIVSDKSKIVGHHEINEIITLWEIDLTKYKLVPIEPTEEMIDNVAGFTHTNKYVYKAMLEVAPSIDEIEGDL